MKTTERIARIIKSCVHNDGEAAGGGEVWMNCNANRIAEKIVKAFPQLQEPEKNKKSKQSA